MNLVEIALATEDIAGGLTKFLTQVAEYAADIASVISELFAISAALRTLATLHTIAAHRPQFPRIQNDLQLVAHVSLRHTLRDVFDAFRRMSAVGQNVESYQQTWQLLWNFFYYQSGYTLLLRLQYYKQMLEEMKVIVKGDIPDEALMAKIRQTISALRVIQDKRHAEVISKQHGGTPMQTSPHPHAHPHAHAHPGVPAAPVFSTPPAPPAPPPPPQQPAAGGPTNPRRSAFKKGSRRHAEMAQRGSFERERPSPITSVPVTPSGSDGSPLSPFSGLDSPVTETTSMSSSSSYNPANGIRHWSVKVFAVELNSLTELTPSGEATRCYGSPMPDAKERLDEEYDDLFQLDFPGKPQMSIVFYLRDRDHKTRVLCKVRSSRSKAAYSTIPITALEAYRDGSCLQLCRKDDDDELVMWANLQFSSIEKMVLFYCTFLALRGQDGSHPITKIVDYELTGELEVYGGQIIDDNFLHALRIFRDHETKSVRIQASVHQGELEKVPVWTAFVHQYFDRKGWCRRVAPRVVYLAELQLITFIDSEEYTPPVNRKGDHVLTFASEQDAEQFAEQMRKLIQYYRDKRRK